MKETFLNFICLFDLVRFIKLSLHCNFRDFLVSTWYLELPYEEFGA